MNVSYALSNGTFKFECVTLITTVTERGWSGIKNGVLLRLVNEEFDLMITMDKGIPHQQNLSNLNLSFLCLSARSNALHHLLPLVPEIEAVIQKSKPNQIYKIGSLGHRNTENA